MPIRVLPNVVLPQPLSPTSPKISLAPSSKETSSRAFSQPVLTKLDVPLGLHTVKLRATNTRNASSSANTIAADVLEVLI